MLESYVLQGTLTAPLCNPGSHSAYWLRQQKRGAIYTYLTTPLLLPGDHNCVFQELASLRAMFRSSLTTHSATCTWESGPLLYLAKVCKRTLTTTGVITQAIGI